MMLKILITNLIQFVFCHHTVVWSPDRLIGDSSYSKILCLKNTTYIQLQGRKSFIVNSTVIQ